MIEFGSDFHFIATEGQKEHTLQSFFPSAQYYADGRQAIISLFKQQGWKRLWVPEYFCYEVVRSLVDNGLSIAFYPDYPGTDDTIAINEVKFDEGDALLRMNYFGTRSFRTNNSIKVPVVEDHTHDLIGGWAIHCDADWCIASLRKTLPVPEGGILWSPQGYRLPPKPSHSEENETVAKRRWQAMKLKAEFISGAAIEKSVFRKEMIDTEHFFDSASVSCIDDDTRDYLDSFNVLDWSIRKQLNRQELESIQAEHFKVLSLENRECNAFSYTILCDSSSYRDYLRKTLIQNRIYPAILWDVPESTSPNVRDFSSRMISIHCDGRYSIQDIRQMKSIIESIL